MASSRIPIGSAATGDNVVMMMVLNLINSPRYSASADSISRLLLRVIRLDSITPTTIIREMAN